MLARKLIMGSVNGPATYINDTFTGSDADDLTAHTPDEGGLPWSLLKSGDTSAYKIYSNKVRKTISGTYALGYSPIVVNPGISNCIITCDLLYSGNPAAIVFRGGTGTSPVFRMFYLFNSAGYSNKINFNYWNGSSFVSDQRSAEILSLTVGQYYTCKVTLNGSSVIAEVNGQTYEITDATTASNTKFGISKYLNEATNVFDNFKMIALS